MPGYNLSAFSNRPVPTRQQQQSQGGFAGPDGTSRLEELVKRIQLMNSSGVIGQGGQSAGPGVADPAGFDPQQFQQQQVSSPLGALGAAAPGQVPSPAGMVGAASSGQASSYSGVLGAAHPGQAGFPASVQMSPDQMSRDIIQRFGRSIPESVGVNADLQGRYRDSLRQRYAPQVEGAVGDFIQDDRARNSTTARFAMGENSMDRLVPLAAGVQQQGATGQPVPIPIVTNGGQQKSIMPDTAAPGAYSVDSSGAMTNANRGNLGNLQVQVGEGGRAQLVPREGWQRPESQNVVTQRMRGELSDRQEVLDRRRSIATARGNSQVPFESMRGLSSDGGGQAAARSYIPSLQRVPLEQAAVSNPADVEALDSRSLEKFIDQISSSGMSDEEALDLLRRYGVTVAELRETAENNSAGFFDNNIGISGMLARKMGFADPFYEASNKKDRRNKARSLIDVMGR